MSVIDVEKLLTPLSESAPSGPDMEYDPGFLDLERTAQGKPEQQMGEKTIAAEPPNWQEVKTKAVALCGRTKDFRIGVLLTRALLRTDGWVGLADGLAYLRGLVSSFWDGVHPVLDPDDRNDPTRRVNVLASLVSADSVLKPLREMPIVESTVLGRFSLRDVMIASGQLPAPGGTEPPTTALIDGAMMAADLQDLKTKEAAIGACVEHVQGLEASLTEKAGAGHSMSFGELTKILRAARQPLLDALGRRGEAVAAVAGEAGGGAPRPPTAEITSREDAIRALDKVSDYFKRQEPSSPVPIFLERAKRLVSKSFVDIVRDLAPDGLSQVENIRGASRE